MPRPSSSPSTLRSRRSSSARAVRACGPWRSRRERRIYVKGTEEYHIEQVNFLAVGTKHEVEAKALPVRQGQVLDMEVEEPHVSNPKDGIARVQGYVIDIEGAGRMVGQRLKVEITKVFRTYAKGRVRSKV